MDYNRRMNVDRICQCCKKPFVARSADVKRGWAKYCSKRCKAIKQEARTGQFSAYLNRGGDDAHGPYAGLDYGTTHGQDPEDAF